MAGPPLAGDSGAALAGGGARAGGTLLLTSDLRLLGMSPELPASLARAPCQLWGTSLGQLLPEVAGRLSALSSDPLRLGSGRAEVIETVIGEGTQTDPTRSDRLTVVAHRMSALAEGDRGWLLSVSSELAGGDSEGLSRQEEEDRGLALLLRVEAEEWVVARLTHDLNNTFQTLSGTLWLMQEQVGGAPNAPNHTARIEAACRHGITQLQVQSGLFQRNRRQQAGLFDTLQAHESALRLLLRGGQQLTLQLEPLSEDVVSDRRVLQNFLLQAGNFVGSHAAPASAVELSLRSAVHDSGAPTREAGLAQLCIEASLPAPQSDERWLSWLQKPGPLWACGKLTQLLGAHFAVQVEGAKLRLLAWFNAAIPRRPESAPTVGSKQPNR